MKPENKPKETLLLKWKTLAANQTVVGDMGMTIVPRAPIDTFNAQSTLGNLPRIDPTATLSEFKVTRTLGQGGMGLVRLARQTSLWRDVAIKTILPDEANAETAQDLLRESWVTGMLEHPNIVPVHALGLDENNAPMLVMTRVEGVSWQSALEDPKNIPAVTRAGRDVLESHLHILMQVCNAVQFAHSKGIIHCDLKPENIMLGDYGEVYLLDWGIAVSLKDDGTGRLPLAKNVDDVAGTPVFIAPELAAGQGDRIREWTDIYLLGAILHMIVTGEPRHDGQTVMAVLLNAYQSKPVEYGADVPSELGAICNKATHVKPEERFIDVSSFRRAIAAFIEHRDSQRLSQEAQNRLQLLKERVLAALKVDPQDLAGEDAAAIYQLFTECRFGFDQALSVWEANQDARHGRRTALRTQLEFELYQRDATAAALLIDELSDVPPEYEERLSRLRGELEAEAEEIQKNKAISHSVNLDLASRERAIMCIFLGIIFGGVPFVNHWLIAQGWATLTFQDYFIQFAVILPLSALVVFVMRARLLANVVNARIITCIFAILAGCLTMRFIGYVLGLDPAGCIALENSLLAFSMLMLAVTIDRRLWPAGLAFLAGSFGGGFYPEYILFFDGGSNAAALWIIAFAWRKPAGEHTTPLTLGSLGKVQR